MDTTILREFVSLHETLSFAETADALCISQSSLTKHIHKLEEDLGVQLFDRSTRSVTRTEFGTAFYPYAKQIVSLEDEGRGALRQLEDWGRNTLRITFTPAVAHYGIVDTLSYFGKQHPEIDLQISEEVRVSEDLGGRSVDFAFATDNESFGTELKKVIYETDHLAVILPERHPLAERESVTFEDIAEESFVLHQNSRGGLHEESKQLLALFSAHGRSPRVTSRVSFTSTILKFVEHGDCISVLPANRIPQDAYGIRAVDLTPPIKTHIYLLYPGRSALGAAARIFLSFILENTGEGE